MKKITFYSICIIVILGTTSFAQSDFAFGVRPGIAINGAYFGVNINGSVVPFVGFDYFGVSGTLEESGQMYDFNLGQLVTYKDTDEGSATVYNLSIGVKYFFMKVQSLKPYFTGSFYKPFISAEGKDDGETIEEIDDVVDRLNLWGMSLGFGTEYYFSENFSVGGEFGMRLFFGSYEQTEKVDVFDPNTGTVRETDRNTEFDLNLQLTYSVVSLNYYF